MRKLYIAYGSNMNVEQMAYRCPRAEVVGVANLKGYELTFRRGVATIEKAEDVSSCVPVVVWSITSSDEKNLDVYEGYPNLYYKDKFLVNINGEWKTAMAYVMTSGKKHSRPSASYLQTIADGYDHFGIDAEKLFAAAIESGLKGEME